MSQEPPIETRPVSEESRFFRQKYREVVVDQANLMDRFATQLITLELAISGLYATVLKLVQGDAATLPATPRLLYATFGCWFASLALTLVALIPKTWKVNPTILIQDPAQYDDDGMGIEDFFQKSASYKKWLLIPSVLLLWLGILFAALLVFKP